MRGPDSANLAGHCGRFMQAELGQSRLCRHEGTVKGLPYPTLDKFL